MGTVIDIGHLFNRRRDTALHVCVTFHHLEWSLIYCYPVGRILLLLNLAQMVFIVIGIALQGEVLVFEDFNPLPTLILPYVTFF